MVIRSTWIAILVGGLVAAFIDIGAASLINSVNPMIILRAIAGGLLGPSSQQLGMPAAVLGFALQEAMGVIIAAIFVLASLRLTWMRRSWVAAGVAYGVVIFFVMNYVVVPLSAYHRFPSMRLKLLADLIAMVLFGMIISAAATKIVER